MKPKQIFISILAVLFVFPLMRTFAQQAANSGSIEVITTFDYPGTVISTQPQKINETGDVVGIFIDSSGVSRGFVRFSDGSFSAPIVDPNDNFGFTEGRDITNSGTVCGDYFRSDGTDHSFFLSGCTTSVLFGLNYRNWVVGGYANSSGVTHGLFFVPPNQFFTFDYPGSTFTSLNGINAQGIICGRYADASGIAHGFLARVRGTPPTTPAGTEMKGFNSPSLVTPLDPSPAAWGGAMPAR